MKYDELISLARAAMGNAYAPYSKVLVGAAILTSSGNVYTGCNVENASFGATICAERCAAVRAVSCGERKFTAVAVVSSMTGITPCGICRQFLSEFSDDMDVVCVDASGNPIIRKLTDFYPFAFLM